MEKVIWPFYHGEHPLILKENNVSKKERVYCYVCGEPVGDLEMAYICMHHDCSSTDSRIILHKKCGELPYEIWHPKHPHHPMYLFDFHLRSRHGCNVCHRDIAEVLGYRCSHCDFDVDIACGKIGIDAVVEERKELQHPSHLYHPLILMRKPAFSFHCNGCDAQDVDMAYICSTCDIMVHKTCASLPAVLPKDHPYNHHHHHLLLAFSFPKEHRKFYYKCEVCDKLFEKKYWVYFCGDCRYFVHLKCAKSTIKPRSNSVEEGGSHMIEFPLYANEIFDKLITPLVMRGTNIPIPDIITPSNSFLFKFHEHRLSLVSKLSDKDEQEYEEEEDVELKICDVCVTPISSPPYYECSASASASCSYSIHFICCFLPNTLHPSSPDLYNCQNHKLTLYAPSKSKGSDAISYWDCDMCDFPTNGMGYKCEECGMKMDVKCASRPTTIRHAAHSHRKPLLLKPTDERIHWCRGCSFILYGTGYRCSDDECDFALHFRCAILPKSIREQEWDKHPLLLTFDASQDHPSDFFCEFCEEEMHPKEWMYHCRQCDVSFHTQCLETKSGCYRNIKFGRRFQLDGIHPNHPLTFTYVTLKRHCDLCPYNVYTDLGLECASCYYVVCEECGCKELDKIS